MKTPRCFLAVVLALVHPCSGGAEDGALPYRAVLDLQTALEAVNEEAAGIRSYCRMEHARPGDERPIEVKVESSGGTLAVELESDGTFKLPPLPAGEADAAVIRHNLGRGDLSLSFGVGLASVVSAADSDARPDLISLVTGFSSRLSADSRKLFGERLASALRTLQPGLPALPPLAVVGVSIPANQKGASKVQLRRGGELVREFDPAGPAGARILFEEYDPATHRLVSEQGSFQTELIVETGPEALRSRHAVPLELFGALEKP